MARILIDGREYEASEGDNLLSAAIALGLDLPYFCWHPALGSAGACRQCAVKEYKDENDGQGRLVMACMTPVRDGQRVSIADEEASEFRASVIEWLMANHPHDCPVCDEGGECHLQDMTVMTGHVYRRFRYPKRTYTNQDLGPFLNHEMNRCITCYRCTRFYNDYAGGKDFGVFASKNHVYFGRATDGTLESPFSGNLVEVCPTGVFTDKTLRYHYTRKWDLQTAPSLCVHCGLGCNTLAGERYGTVRRIANRYHSEINGYFLCDRGRYGYEFVNSEDRVRTAVASPRRAHANQPLESEGPLAFFAGMVQGKRLIGIGSPRASLESNYALWRLVGKQAFSSGMHSREHDVVHGVLDGLREFGSATLSEAEQCDAVVIFGDDVEATAPRLSLTLRQSVRQAAFVEADKLQTPRWQDVSIRDATCGVRSPLYVISPTPSALDEIAAGTRRLRPDELEGFAQVIAAAIGKGALRENDLASKIARSLTAANRPLVVCGGVQGGIQAQRAALTTAGALRQAGKDVSVIFTVEECNSVGALLIGGDPLDSVEVDGQAAVIVLENDLYRHGTGASIDALLKNAGAVIVLDCLSTPTTAQADLIFPAAAFPEGDGTWVNNEGRAQRAVQVHAVASPIRESWRWLGEMGAMLGRTPKWERFDEAQHAMGEDFPVLAGAAGAAPAADYRPLGMPIPRQPHRYSGRTSMFADRTMDEPPPPPDPDSPMAFSMEGYSGTPPPALMPRYWIPRWNSYQAMTLYARAQGGAAAPGVKLIAPAGKPAERAAHPTPARAPWMAVAIHHVFGSEELSARAPAIASRAPMPYAALNHEDAAELGVAEGELIEVAAAGVRWQLPVRFLSLARRLVGVPSGISPVVGALLPCEATVRRGR